MIYGDRITAAEDAGKVRGHFAIARGVRQGCLASGCLVAVAFDPNFWWWLDVVIIPRDLSPSTLSATYAKCPYADDVAVAATSFRTVILIIASAFRIIDRGTVCASQLKQGLLGSELE